MRAFNFHFLRNQEGYIGPHHYEDEVVTADEMLGAMEIFTEQHVDDTILHVEVKMGGKVIP